MKTIGKNSEKIGMLHATMGFEADTVNYKRNSPGKNCFYDYGADSGVRWVKSEKDFSFLDELRKIWTQNE